MSISVTDGQGTARTDARLGYVVTVRNEGSVPLRGLRLEQRVPGPAGGLTAGQGGSAHGDVVSWTVDLPGRTSRRFHVEAVVGRSASSDAQQSRLVVTACAFPVGDRMPGVCATDLDRLAVSARSVPAAGGGAVSTSAGIAAALAAAVGGALLVLRQRSRRFRLDTAVSAASEDQTA
ncbi:hypothetical protein [Streptacidiphilus monticola]|uniref:DUF11 domain-containing protein n=1 Tax=Streptacidiphilus monticola TaxID=2161674 RepID=A0ABW1FZX5_9ACTN